MLQVRYLSLQERQGSIDVKSRNSVCRLAVVIVLALVSGALAGCNRAGARIPGASLPFPPTPTGYSAGKPFPYVAAILMPIDTRPQHYDKRVAGTDWTACRTDPFWATSATSIVHDRLSKELESAKLFTRVSRSFPQAGDVVIRSEVRAFCSQAVGFLILTVAGISSIHIEVEQNGRTLLTRTFERVVTDDDPQYTGLQIATIEQAMVTSMGDSLRELLRDAVRYFDRELQR